MIYQLTEAAGVDMYFCELLSDIGLHDVLTWFSQSRLSTVGLECLLALIWFSQTSKYFSTLA